jgi:dTDP-4-dehydrorhamnose reductase
MKVLLTGGSGMLGSALHRLAPDLTILAPGRDE